jgi:hypothetical protein
MREQTALLKENEVEVAPDDFGTLLRLEQTVQEEAARAAAAERIAEQQRAAAARAEREAAKRRNEELTVILQQDAAKVAVAAHKQVVQDAVFGRYLSRTVGWLVWIGVQRHHDDYREVGGYHTWVTVNAVVLSLHGTLNVTKPIVVGRSERFTTLVEQKDILRRTSGMVQVKVTSDESFNFYRHLLAGYAVTHRLQF